MKTIKAKDDELIGILNRLAVIYGLPVEKDPLTNEQDFKTLKHYSLIKNLGNMPYEAALELVKTDLNDQVLKKVILIIRKVEYHIEEKKCSVSGKIFMRQQVEQQEQVWELLFNKYFELYVVGITSSLNCNYLEIFKTKFPFKIGESLPEKV